MGKFLAAQTFVTHCPAVVMDLPPAAIHDSKAHLRERAVCDERISLPLSCFKDLDTPGSVWLQLVALKNVVSVASDPYKRANYSTTFAHVLWGKLECGLVLSPVSPWEYIPKERGIRAARGFACKYGFWKGSKGSSRGPADGPLGRQAAELATDPGRAPREALAAVDQGPHGVVVILALGASPPASFLEHLEDPAQCSKSPSAHQCFSIWAIGWLRNMLQALGLNLIHFDQCRLGQCAPKPTALATNLDLRHWEQLRCNHETHQKSPGTISSDLSRYPWNMMQGLARAILQSDAAQGAKPKLQPSSKTDRPLSQTQSPKMTLEDDPVRVQLGFRIRPIRDGGGKPSQGRLPPPLRRHPPCGDLCRELAAICEPWVEDFTSSIHSGNKAHPFSIHLLRELREKLASHCTTTGDPRSVDSGTFPP